MTPTEKARRSDALYYETVSVTRRVLCDAIANRESDLEDARAENAKLRELVRILKNCADECGDCDTCPINDGSGVLNPWLGCDSLRDRMRDLGVEVDG